MIFQMPFSIPHTYKFIRPFRCPLLTPETRYCFPVRIENRIDSNTLQRSVMFQGYRGFGCPAIVLQTVTMAQSFFGCSRPDNLQSLAGLVLNWENMLYIHRRSEQPLDDSQPLYLEKSPKDEMGCPIVSLSVT